MIPALRLSCAFAFATALLSVANAQLYTFEHHAGLPPQFGTADGVGNFARFNRPVGAVVDSAGNIFVADSDNHVIRKITPAGVVSTLAGSPGQAGWADGTGSAARFSQPYGIALDAAGTLWVADYDNHIIRRITSKGVVTTFAGEPQVKGASDGAGLTAHFDRPVGIAVDGAGNLYVADRFNGTIRKITAAGLVSTLAGRAGMFGIADGNGSNALFYGLSGMAIDPNGDLFVTDDLAHTVRKITPAGVVSTYSGLANTHGSRDGTGTGARFYGLRGIASDSNGNLIVADTYNSTIRKISPTGSTSTLAGYPESYGYTNAAGEYAQFFWPMGVATDTAGNVYVLDTFNHSVRKISSAGVVSLLAGGGGNVGANDGKRRDSSFYAPAAVAAAADGTLYVTDSGSYTIRRVSPGGVVTTLAGSPREFDHVDGKGSAARFGYPMGIAVGADGNVYVSDMHYNTIRRVTLSGEVSVFAGVPNPTGGVADGAPGVGRFFGPLGLAAQSDGSLYVADQKNHTIRKVASDGTISTVAGMAGFVGSTDGPGTSARFSAPAGIAVGSDGTLFVADTGNSTLRKITRDGNVTTLAGRPETRGDTDGVGANARFTSPYHLAVDQQGNLYVCDYGNSTIRKVAPDGRVSTIGGVSGPYGYAEGSGDTSRFFGPAGIALDGAGQLYVADIYNSVIYRGVAHVTPTIVAAPQSLSLRAGGNATLAVSATGNGLSYQWEFNGTAIPGATASSYALTNVQTAQIGQYAVRVTNSAGSLTSEKANLTLTTSTNLGRISNLSIRSKAGTDSEALIVGFGIRADNPAMAKPLLVRAIGPNLALFGLPGLLLDPMLEVFNSGGTRINVNDDWAGNAEVAAIGSQLLAYPIASSTSKDAALYEPGFTKGTFSVKISGKGGSTGIALAEIYDATTGEFDLTTPRLVNVSARTHAGVGGDVLIAGFYVVGDTAKNVLIRAIGPTLGTYGVPGAMTDPKLELYTGPTKINENDDWGGSATLSSAFDATGAFGIPKTSRDAVLVVTLAPGGYTVQVSGLDNATGVALVEVYEMP